MRRFLFVLALSCSSLDQAWAQDISPSIDPVVQAEIDLAKANTKLVKVAPKLVSGPRAEFPASEKALGHNGEVLIRGVLGVDGKLSHLTIGKSSKTPALDASALKAASATTYSPAKDALGKSIPVWMSTSFVFYNHADNSRGSTYSCRQFVLDMDWWKQTYDTYENHELYRLLLGFGIAGGLSRQMTPAQVSADYDLRWSQAIETCRTQPKSNALETLQR